MSTTDVQLTSEEILGLRELLDARAIQAVMLRYVRCIDRNEPSEMETIFWEDGTDNHGTYNGPADGFFAKNIKNPSNHLTRYHLLGPARVDFIANNQAKVESYFLYSGTTVTEEGPTLGELRGRFRDLFEKRSGQWRILRRTVIYDSARAIPYHAAWGWFGIAESGVNHAAFYQVDGVYHDEW